MCGTETTMKAAVMTGMLACAVIFAVRPGAHHQANATSPTAVPDAVRTPVLVELFTSEGCSSCPPADELLRKLDESQPVAGAEVIALSEHVDYWDGIGWKDPFSAHANSERQDSYADRFQKGSVYTPQMVVDGQFEFVGSDAHSATQAIGRAAGTPKIAVNVGSIQKDQKGRISVRVQSGPLPAAGGTKSANVLIAVADDRDVSSVERGENSGRTLTHVAVLRELRQAGTVDKTNGLSKNLEMNIAATSGKKLRIIAIVQEGHEGKVLGVASTTYPN